MSWILVNLTNIEEILKKDPYLLRYYHKGVTKAADKLYWCHKILHATTLTEFNHKLKAEERKQHPPWGKKKDYWTGFCAGLVNNQWSCNRYWNPFQNPQRKTAICILIGYRNKHKKKKKKYLIFGHLIRYFWSQGKLINFEYPLTMSRICKDMRI